mgnify:CR=1 FL=1
MAGNDKKSKNFLVSKIGGQQLIVLGVIVALFAFFCIKSDIFRSYTTILSMLDLDSTQIILICKTAQANLRKNDKYSKAFA